jgi:hypothetical protein
LLLIGIGLIFLLRMPFFPTILAVLGLSSILARLATGQGWHGLQGGIWLVGLFLLFYFDIFLPGILILIGVLALIGALTRPMLKWPRPQNKKGRAFSARPLSQPLGSRPSVIPFKQLPKVSIELFNEAVKIQYFVTADGPHFFEGRQIFSVRIGDSLYLLRILCSDGGHDQALQATMPTGH